MDGDEDFSVEEIASLEFQLRSNRILSLTTQSNQDVVAEYKILQPSITIIEGTKFDEAA